jgi:SAM-dependent methyltransferase
MMAIQDGRQVSPILEGIRRDHRERYRFAARFIPAGGSVLDAACGIGYGSWMLAQLARPAAVIGVDVSTEAIAYGLCHYPHPRVALVRADLLLLDLGDQRFDVIVSFETLEHIAEDRAFLARLRRALAPDGTLIISTPNQDVMPFDPDYYDHHLRHYTSAEFADLLTETGLAVRSAHTQVDREQGAILPCFGGAFDIAVCRRAASLPDCWAVPQLWELHVSGFMDHSGDRAGGR